MSRYKYIKIPIWSLSKQIMDEYKLHDLVRNGYVLCEICCGMYSLPQSGIIAYEQLLQVLSPFLYAPARHTPGLWRHMTLKITFSLCIDNFGIKYIGRQHVDHLLAALKDKYEATTDWTGGTYLGITIKWDYEKQTCDLSMPGYIKAALHCSQHTILTHSEHSPHQHTKIQYSAPVQFAPMDDASAPLDSDGIIRIQQIVVTLLH